MENAEKDLEDLKIFLDNQVEIIDQVTKTELLEVIQRENPYTGIWSDEKHEPSDVLKQRLRKKQEFKKKFQEWVENDKNKLTQENYAELQASLTEKQNSID